MSNNRQTIVLTLPLLRCCPRVTLMKREEEEGKNLSTSDGKGVVFFGVAPTALRAHFFLTGRKFDTSASICCCNGQIGKRSRDTTQCVCVCVLLLTECEVPVCPDSISNTICLCFYSVPARHNMPQAWELMKKILSEMLPATLWNRLFWPKNVSVSKLVGLTYKCIKGDLKIWLFSIIHQNIIEIGSQGAEK